MADEVLTIEAAETASSSESEPADVGSRGLTSIFRRRRALEASLIASQVLGLATSVVLARGLGPAGRGTIITLALWAQVLAWTGCFSLDKAVAVLVRREDIGLDEAMRVARRTVSGLSAVVAAVGSSVYYAVTGSVVLTLVLATAVVSGAFYELNMGRLLAKQDEQRYALARLVQPASYAFSVGGLWVATNLLTVSGATELGLFGSAFATSTIVGVLVSHVADHQQLRDRASARKIRRRLGSFALRAHPAVFFQFLNGRLDILLAGILLTRADVGQYAVASAGGQVLVFLGSAAAARGIIATVAEIDRRAMLAVAGLAVMGLLIAPWAIELVYGPAYRPSVDSARILLLGGVAGYAAAGVCGRLIGGGRPGAAALAQAAGVLALIVGFLVGPRTIEFLAVASSSSYLVAAVIGMMLGKTAGRSPVAPA